MLSVPESCKVAKLKPLFKKGSKLVPNNFRAISLLPLISKVLEKVIHDQMQIFLTVISYTATSQVSENFTLLTLASHT